jgi:membrane-associated phospholipid phosphatase
MCGLAAIAAGIRFADRRAAIIVWILVSLWAFGRIGVGVHYASDIAGGILIGCTAAYIGRKVVLAFESKVLVLLKLGRRFYLA